MNPDSFIPLLSDGRVLYLAAEVSAPSSPFQVEYRLYGYDPAQTFECVSATTLQGPHTLTGQHQGVVCDGCQRHAFRGNRYRYGLPPITIMFFTNALIYLRCSSAATCRDYNLCHTCQQLGVVSKQHTREHVMQTIIEPQPGNEIYLHFSFVFAQQ